MPGLTDKMLRCQATLGANNMYPIYTTGKLLNVQGAVIAKVTRTLLPEQYRAAAAYIADDTRSAPSVKELQGYKLVLIAQECHSIQKRLAQLPMLAAEHSLSHLNDGDIIYCDGKTARFRTIYRRGSPHNMIFTTEACNSSCLMCSQPPKEEDPHSRMGTIMKQIELFDPDTKVICISGGEPTLLGDDLLKIIETCKVKYPNMTLHLLTNGRLLSNRQFAESYAAVNHPLLTAGIPLYSDVDYLHDYVVQAKNAFRQTIAGIHNLGALYQRIEIRVVVHKQTYERLPNLAEYIFRNMPFVNHIAFMGLEITGYTKFNLDDLWIDPYDYQDQLTAAVLYLSKNGMNVSIYNHQLCVLSQTLWPYARASVSDWKQIYDDECIQCDVRGLCGGFFKWAPNVRSAHIKAIKLSESQPKHSQITSAVNKANSLELPTFI